MTLRVSYDADTFDYDRIIPFIQQSYWALGRPAGDIRRSFARSFAVGLFEGDVQLGAARVTSDTVVVGYISDLFVFEEYRGRGLAHRLMQAIFDHPELTGVKSWLLATSDAHGFYEKYGFAQVDPGIYMRLRTG